MLEGRQSDLEKKVEHFIRVYENCDAARTVLNTVLLETQEQAVGFICDVTTRLLQHVFGPDYELQFKASVERNRPALTPFIAEDGNQCSPRDELGGGVLDVASLGVRLAQWAIEAEPSPAVFVLDEPGKFIDRQRVSLFGEALRGIVEALGLQIVLVTHLSALEGIADRAYFVEKVRGVSRLTESA